VKETACLFCKIIKGELAADIVYQDEEAIAFLDHRPLFPGHVLLSSREHYETLLDVPPELAGSLMRKTQQLARAVETAMNADGTFIAVNNRVSQSVPHLHIHVVPRKRRDGLRGFFWPRHHYQDDGAREAARTAIAREMEKLLA
jgi:histidine triad (HIT) family protein